MKMSIGDFLRLKAAISPLVTPEIVEKYERGNFPRSERVKDLGVRFRWDLFWSAGGNRLLSGDLDNSHIDTALRQIVPLFAGCIDRGDLFRFFEKIRGAG